MLSINSPSTRKVIRILYAGSLLYGRWKALSLLLDAMERTGGICLFPFLDIYSQYEPSGEMLHAIVRDGYSAFHGSVDSARLKKLLASSDMVLHAESFDEEDIAITKYSFSTKIVDCLASGACVLGVGPEAVAALIICWRTTWRWLLVRRIGSKSYSGACMNIPI